MPGSSRLALAPALAAAWHAPPACLCATPVCACAARVIGSAGAPAHRQAGVPHARIAACGEVRHRGAPAVPRVVCCTLHVTRRTVYAARCGLHVAFFASYGACAEVHARPNAEWVAVCHVARRAPNACLHGRAIALGGADSSRMDGPFFASVADLLGDAARPACHAHPVHRESAGGRSREPPLAPSNRTTLLLVSAWFFETALCALALSTLPWTHRPSLVYS